MSLDDLIRLMEARLAALNAARGYAAAVGDLNQVVTLDPQILQTQQTLDQLRTLT